MGDIQADIQLNVNFSQSRSHEEKSESKKSALQRKLEWKKRREEITAKREARLNSEKGNEKRPNKSNKKTLKGRKENVLDSSTNEHKKGIGVKNTDGGEIKKNEAKSNNQQGKIDNKLRKFNNRGQLNNRQGQFNNPPGQFNNRPGQFNNRRGQFNNRRGQFNNRPGQFNNRPGQFNNRQGQFNNQQGQFNNRRGQFNNRRGQFKQRKNRGKPVEPPFANSILRNAMLPIISDATQPQYIFHKFAEMSTQNSSLKENESNSNLNSSLGKQKKKAKGKKSKLTSSSKLEESVSEAVSSNATGEEIVSFKKAHKFSGKLEKTKAGGPSAPGLFFRKSKKLMVSKGKSVKAEIPRVSDTSSKEIAVDADHGLPSNDQNTVLTSEVSKSDVKSASPKRKNAIGSSNEGKRKKRKKGENISSPHATAKDADHELPSNVQNVVFTSEDSKSGVKSASQKPKNAIRSSNEGKRKKRKKGENFSSSQVTGVDADHGLPSNNRNTVLTSGGSKNDVKSASQTRKNAIGSSNEGKHKKLKKGENISSSHITAEDADHELRSNDQNVVFTSEDSKSDVKSASRKRKDAVDGSKEGKCKKGENFSSVGGGVWNSQEMDEGEDMDFGSEGDLESEEINSDHEENAADSKVTTSLFKGNPKFLSGGYREVEPVKGTLFSKQMFADLDIHKFQVSNLETLGLKQLTVVQSKAIPPLLEGRDALVRSQTGSGKTLAYALPILERLQRQQPRLTRADGIRALIVLPTRELVLQTYDWFIKLTRPFVRLVTGMVLSGDSRKREKARLRKGITILMGTPGRIRDHLQNTVNATLHHVQYLVLDEADCMLDMGYEGDIAGIVRLLKRHRKSGAPQVLWKGIRKQSVNEVAIINKREEKSSSANKSRRIVFKNDDEEQENSPEERSIEEEKNAKEIKRERTSGVVVKEEEEEEDSDYDPEILADEAIPVIENENDKKATCGRDESDSSEDSDASTEDQSESEEDDDENERSPARRKVRLGTVSMLEAEAEEKEAKGRGHWQSILLSATLSPAVERLAGLVLRSPIFVDAADVKADSTDVVIPHTLAQSYMVVPMKLRLVVLSAFIAWKCKFTDERKILLFCSTQDMVNYLTELLTIGLGKSDDDLEEPENVEESTLHLDIEFFRLHGHMEQTERTHVFQTFRAAKSGVLLCTDVAARGLDMPHVDWIVQYTAPGSVANYVHRVGRTARLGAKGNAVLFLLPSEVMMVEVLQDRRIRLEEQDFLVELENMLLVTRYQNSNKHFKTKEDAATSLQLMYENSVVHRSSLHDMAIKAFQSYLRLYASYPREVRDVLPYKGLHVGHVAKSFALRNPPSKISAIGRRRAQIDTNKQPQRHLNPNLELYGNDVEGQVRTGAKPRGGQRQNKRLRGWSSRRDGEDNFFGRPQKKYDQNLVLSEFASGIL